MSPPQPRPTGALAAHIAAEGARLAAACTGCGACVRACPITPYAPAIAAAGAPAVAAGLRALLLGAEPPPATIAWVGACCRSGQCTPACPEGLPVQRMLHWAQMRLRGALGEAPRVDPRPDPQLPARVKAFARLGMTEQEQAAWL